MEAALEQQSRPKSVVLLEAVSIFSAVATMLLTQGESALGELAELLFWVGLTLWVTRGRSRVARVIYTGLLFFGTAALAGAYMWGYVPPDAPPGLLASFTIELVALLSLLWWPSTSAWLNVAHRRA